MKRLAIAAAAAVLMTATGGAEEPRDDREAEQEKRICRSEKMTGSLTRVRRICLTRSEWSRLAEVTRKGVDELRRDGDQASLEREKSPLAGGGGW